MGRTKKILTPDEVLERKQRWWGEERNARRRDRYAQDGEYRVKTIQQVRDGYRRDRHAEGLNVRDDDCADSLSKLTFIGKIREVSIRGHASSAMLSFTLEEAAIAFGRNRQIIYRWLKSEMIPHPVLVGRNERNRWQPVYLESEIRMMLEVFSGHQKRSQYFRSFHIETKIKLFEGVRCIREENDLFPLSAPPPSV